MLLSDGELSRLRGPLLEGLARLNLDAPDGGRALADRLLSYTREVYRFNEALGLVDAEPEVFIYAHLLDSLALLAPAAGVRELLLPGGSAGQGGSERADASRVIDVGSGAGLPGIPLALACEELSLTLMDRSGRRCGFLRNAVAMLGRRDIEVVERDLARLDARNRGRFNLLLARAFRPLKAEVYRELSALLDAGGQMLLYKGRKESVEEEVRALTEELGHGRAPEAEITPLAVPGLDRERTLLRLRMSA